MTIFYKINSSADGAVLSVFGDVNESITSEAKSFDEAVRYLTSTAPADLDRDEVSRLMSPKDLVESYLRRVSDRVSFKGNTLLFDGDEVNNSLADTIIRLSTEDESGDPTKLVKFLENLMTNPSEHSREQLYDWISPRNITITNDGHFLAYKGLRKDFTSIHAGPGIVNSVEYTNASLDNSPGNVVEFSRSKVVANSGIGCAVGLHAGTHEYASSFAQGKLVLVKINPRDVVSVPTDCDAQKLRVCRYEVLEEVEAKYESVIYTDQDGFIDPEYSEGGSLDYLDTSYDDEDEYDVDPYEDEDDDYDEEEDYWDESEEEDDDEDEDDGFGHLRGFMKS